MIDILVSSALLDWLVAHGRLVIPGATRATAFLKKRLGISSAAVTSTLTAVTSGLVATASLAALGTDSGSLATGAVHLLTGQNPRFGSSITTAASRWRVAAVTSIRTAVAGSIWVQSATIGTTWCTDAHSVAACTASLLGRNVSVHNIICRKTTAAARAHELRRLRWTEGQVKEARKHEDAEKRHGEKWIDEDESQDRGEHNTLKHSEAEETAVWESMATHLSEDVRRKWRNGTNTATNSILNLGLDCRVGINSLENLALHFHMSMHATSDSMKVLAKHHERDNSQDNVDHREV